MRRDAGGLKSLPDFIALPRDEDGRPIIPTSRVTALVEAREAWSTELGTLDAVTRSITRGQLVMPRVSAPSQQTVLRNHPSWENDEDAKRALGPVIAKWLASGVLEYVAWNDRMPILLQPCGHGAVLSAHHGRSLRQQALFGLGSHVHHRSATQQYAEPLRLPFLRRHFRRLPPGALGRVRRRAPSDPAAHHHVSRAGPAQRGNLGRRAGQWVYTVVVPWWLRQGFERTLD